MNQAWELLSSTLARLLPSAHDSMVQQEQVTIGAHPNNLPLNRYNNIIPFDHHLIQLSTQHYLNASHVHVAQTRRPFVIAQCPMHPDYHGADTTNEFWQSVVECRVKCIVNLARVEKGYSGAALYWPQRETETFLTHDWKVECLSVDHLEPTHCLTRRRLRVTPRLHSTALTTSANNSVSGMLELNHYHFQRWPNYDVATSPAETCQLLQCVLRERNVEDEDEEVAATLVHCSGGVGRSGTFVAAVCCVEQLLDESECGEHTAHVAAKTTTRGDAASLANRLGTIVQTLREQRHPWMVEGWEQFLFCSRLVLAVMEDKQATKK